MSSSKPVRVGEVRPSQILFSYGVGSIVDLPHFSVIVTGLDDWKATPDHTETVIEDRLLTAVRYRLPAVQKLLSPPIAPETGRFMDPFSSESHVGVPVATFPRWMVCPHCRLLAPLNSGLFKLREQPYRPDRTAYFHETCNKAKRPEVVPARFLVACRAGHLDDFPWREYVHRGAACEGSLLRLIEYGATGEARDLEVRCDTCDSRRRLSEAFRREKGVLPRCRGRRPHLRDFDPEPCDQPLKTLILGASNTWFPVVYSVIAMPVESGQLAKLIELNWAILQNVRDASQIALLRSIGQLGAFVDYDEQAVWEAIVERRKQDAGERQPPSEEPDLKAPEWELFTRPEAYVSDAEFRLKPVPVPNGFAWALERVVLVERLREVRALIGFSRLDALGELTDPDMQVQIEPAPLSRSDPSWVPAAEVRGEGIFIQFREEAIEKWLEGTAVEARADKFLESHVRWRQSRYIQSPEEAFPGMRYVFIHSFAHALMRQLALESGYSAASIRERIYARATDSDYGPMAGLLLYTSAPDSEGTLGGLVEQGKPEALSRHFAKALEAVRLCASDPLCAEHPPSRTGQTLHAAACHACLFMPETSCERGNKYLDRSTLVATVEHHDIAFFR